ncbi:hypothetical protein [Silvanigrella aquatica]|uniref:Uncharacterized protein n=1 Tax=Silvanigrella aquatica TaxID=1915309 RepID=A0A1L4D163_9BACT|nr:hypothetical protein [Silvanigrella aquatica]APJ03927.1 hypothetical protein AXG55_08425 [Silvanigrella aquatica]
MSKKIIATLIIILIYSCNINSTESDINSIKNPDIFTVDLPNPGKFINNNLWIENKLLDSKKLYEKYKSKYNSYGIFLEFDQENNIIAQDKKSYPLFKYNSFLEKELSLHYNDYDRGKIVAASYYKNIYPIIQSNQKIINSFEWFLYRYSNYLNMESEEILKKIEIYSILYHFFTKDSHNKEKFIAFIHDINIHYKNPPKSVQKIKKIAIISGPYGGGHHSTAEIIKKTIQEKDNYQFYSVDECNDFPDTLYIMTRHLRNESEQGYHACRIYNDVFVNEGNFEKNDLLYLLSYKLTDYLPYNRYGELYKKLKKAEVDIIISTVHHISQITAFSYMLKVPMRILITDYEFPQNQWFDLNLIDSKLVKYWIPTIDYRGFFRTMVHDNDKKDNWEAKIYNRRSEIIKRKLFQNHSQLKIANILDELEVFDYLPFPSSHDFTPPKNVSDSFESRKTLGLSLASNRKVITIAMGGSPNVQSMLNLVKQLINISNQIDHNVEFSILTSGKENVIDEIKNHILPMNELLISEDQMNTESNENIFPNKITFKLLPKLNYESEMPHVYKSSDIIISKSGGATTTEIMNSSTPFIRGFGLYPWEVENVNLLEMIGLAYHEKDIPTNSSEFLHENLSEYLLSPSNRKLIQQINYFLNRPRPKYQSHKFDEIYLFKYLDEI